MYDEIVTISINFPFILRCSGGLIWGVLWAIFIQFNNFGKFLCERRTWITVVIGVGVDLIIAYPGNWWTVFAVVAFSSVGIIFRSMWNESNGTNYNAHKMKQGIEDCMVITQDIIKGLAAIIEVGALPQKELSELAGLLAMAYRLKDTFIRARRESAKSRRK